MSSFEIPQDPEKAESFSTKKDIIVAHLEEQLKAKNVEYDSFEKSTESKQEYYKKTPPLGPIPKEVLGDGGSDLSEWRAQVGHDREERRNVDESKGLELDYLSEEISLIERDLQWIESLEDYPVVLDELDGDHDAKIFEHLFGEAKKVSRKS